MIKTPVFFIGPLSHKLSSNFHFFSQLYMLTVFALACEWEEDPFHYVKKQ